MVFEFFIINVCLTNPKMVPRPLIFNTQYYITVPRTCMEYKSKGSFQSGTYLIDPVQKKGSSSKFSVFCDFENGKFVQYTLNYNTL